MEKEDYIWRRKIYFFRGEQNQERKFRNKFGHRKYIVAGKKIHSRGKGGKYL